MPARHLTAADGGRRGISCNKVSRRKRSASTSSGRRDLIIKDGQLDGVQASVQPAKTRDLRDCRSAKLDGHFVSRQG